LGKRDLLGKAHHFWRLEPSRRHISGYSAAFAIAIVKVLTDSNYSYKSSVLIDILSRPDLSSPPGEEVFSSKISQTEAADSRAACLSDSAKLRTRLVNRP
jgi:hypothetical protein